MTTYTYPELVGLSWNTVKTPSCKTYIQTSASRKEKRISFESQPLWEFKVSYEFLDKDDFDTLCGFFLQVGGALNYFYFDDKTDNTVTGQVIGVANGAISQFKCIRKIDNYIEPIYKIKGNPTVKIDGVVQDPETYYINNINGVEYIEFDTPPSPGSVTLDCGFYFRLRFVNDKEDFTNFTDKLWKTGTIELISVK